MARHDGGKGRPAWSWVGVIAVVLGPGTVTRALSGGRTGIEPNPAARWVAADAPIYLEVARPAVLIDHLLDRRLQAALDAVPSSKRSLKSDSYRPFRAVVDRLADTLGMTWQQGLCDLTSGGLVLAVEGEAEFHSDLAAGQADRVALLTFSEFGRRVRENASQGTNHGAAAPLFVVGPVATARSTRNLTADRQNFSGFSEASEFT